MCVLTFCRNQAELSQGQDQVDALVPFEEFAAFIKTGHEQDMNQAFTAIGWEDFTDVIEPGSHLVTIKFLISLSVEETDTKN